MVLLTVVVLRSCRPSRPSRPGRDDKGRAARRGRPKNEKRLMALLFSRLATEGTAVGRGRRPWLPRPTTAGLPAEFQAEVDTLGVEVGAVEGERRLGSPL